MLHSLHLKKIERLRYHIDEEPLPKRKVQSYLETPCFTRTLGTGGGGSSANLRASSVGGGGTTVAVTVGVEPIDLALGLPLPLDLGLPGGGGREEGAGDTLFSFSS